MTAVYFGIVMWNGCEIPQLFYDHVPMVLTRPNSPLVYCARLDLMPNADAIVATPLRDLFAVYLRLKRGGKLPPDDRGGKPALKPGTTSRKLGEWWEPLPPTWDPWQPFADEWKP